MLFPVLHILPTIIGDGKGGINYDNQPFYFEYVHPKDRERVLLYPAQVKYGAMINWTQEYESVMITEAGSLHGQGKRILDVNEAFTKMSGYTAEDAIGKTPSFLQGQRFGSL